MRAQVQGATRTLLLGNASNADADAVAAFMLGVFSAQVTDAVAGNLAAQGATGGVENLKDLAADPNAPCTPLAPQATCTPDNPAQPTMTLFDAWANLASGDPRNEARAAIARGQVVFNTRGCPACHATDNLGNHPNPTFFRRLRTDSIPLMQALAQQDARVQPLLERVQQLPEYCLRPNSTISTDSCGTVAGDVMTTDPGRALVTGLIADVGLFKPPVLRNLAARAPYFHNGAAETIDDLINFYNARFNLGLTPEQHDDLAAFLNAL